MTLAAPTPDTYDDEIIRRMAMAVCDMHGESPEQYGLYLDDCRKYLRLLRCAKLVVTLEPPPAPATDGRP